MTADEQLLRLSFHRGDFNAGAIDIDGLLNGRISPNQVAVEHDGISSAVVDLTSPRFVIRKEADVGSLVLQRIDHAGSVGNRNELEWNAELTGEFFDKIR